MSTTIFRGKRILVTGGSGFVGRWLIRALQPQDPILHICDLVPPARVGEKFEFHRIDLAQLDEVKQFIATIKPHFIFHLAGQPGVAASHNDPAGAFTSNAVVTFNLLEAARQLPDLAGFVAVSTNHVYGDQETMPTPEDAALNGLGMYGASKICSDVLARVYGKTYGLPISVARITNSYGGDDHHVSHIITATILAALRNEQPTINQSGRDRKGYLYVEDTVAGLIAAAQGVATSPELRGEAFNVVPNEAITVRDLVYTICSLVGKPTEPLIKNPEAHYEDEQLDNSKARQLLSWTPKNSLEEGLRKSIQWYREHFEAYK